MNEQTICFECKYCIKKSVGTHSRCGKFKPIEKNKHNVTGEPQSFIFKINGRDIITSDSSFPFCMDINKGRCSDFSPKKTKGIFKFIKTLFKRG